MLSEEYLDIAISKWYPASIHDGGTAERLALYHIAAILRNNGDSWLSDLLSIPNAKSSYEAAIALAHAVRANAGDRSIEAEHDAQSAIAQFQLLGNAAGSMRAQLELVYALGRSLDGNQCLAIASELEPQLRRHKYVLELGVLLLNRGVCWKITGNLGNAGKDIQHALELANAHYFPVLRLRAIGLSAALSRVTGDAIHSWRADRAGLLEFWSGAFPGLREHQFCSDLRFWAEDAHLWHAAVAFSIESVQAVSEGGNRLTEAVARSTLANAADAAGYGALAQEEYQNASTLFSNIPDDSLSRADRVYSELRLAILEAEEGRIEAAFQKLNRLKPQIASEMSVQLALHGTLGYVLLRRGDPLHALEEFNAATRWTKKGSTSLKNNEERDRWQSTVAAVYRGAARCYISLGRWDRALEIWLSRPGPSSSLRSGIFTVHNRLNVVYLQYDDGIAVWAVGDGRVTHSWSEVPRRSFEHVLERFVSICAERSSAEGTVRELGAKLYASLLRPIEHILDPRRTVVVHTDGAISSVPFEALVTGTGRFVGEDFAIARAVGPPTAFGPAAPITVADIALLVGAPVINANSEYPPLPDASRELADIAARFHNPTVLTGRSAVIAEVQRALPNATLFHFAGHALSSGAVAGLVLSDLHGMAEIMSISSLKELSMPRCKLVVLSACSTGLGTSLHNADPANLVDGLFRAGAMGVVATRWDVDSTVTAMYMHYFYDSLLNGNDPASAIRQASRAVRSTAPTRHPFYWAAFESYTRPRLVTGVIDR